MRIRVVVTALIIAVSVLASVGAAGAPEGEQGQTEGQEQEQGELVINSSLSREATKAAFAEVVEDFEAEYPNIDVTVNTFDIEAYTNAIRNFLVSNPPDVVTWSGGERMRFFVEKGLLMDITDVWDRANLHDAMASSRAAVTVDGKQYGIPRGYYQWGFFYRRDIFEEYGLSEPETWDDFMNVGETLLENGITPVAIGTRFLWTAAGWFDYLNLRINGLDYHISLMEGEASYLDSELDEVFATWGDLVERGFFLEDHATFDWQEGLEPYTSGDAAMYLMGNFIVPALESAGVRDNTGFFQFPIINPEIGVYEDAPLNTYHVPSGATNFEEAKLFMEFVARPDIQAQYAYAVGNIPPNKNAPPPEDRFTRAGFELLNEADGLAQFYDRDTPPEMAQAGMEGFQEFMTHPERLPEIRQRIDEQRKKIFEQE